MAENLDIQINNLVNATMFVEHVRCLHNQIQTVLKMSSIKKNIYKFTMLSNGRIIVDDIYILASCDQH
jgi:hypothetical protein